ncbi:hypothetical protein B0H14DRAFT_2568953 [Mycena olivaceomarginata]|nr:hypothetical protein B0H14DRAFT_2568953 [Mycena olivaceomarginata]
MTIIGATSLEMFVTFPRISVNPGSQIHTVSELLQQISDQYTISEKAGATFLQEMSALPGNKLRGIVQPYIKAECRVQNSEMTTPTCQEEEELCNYLQDANLYPNEFVESSSLAYNAAVFSIEPTSGKTKML